MYRVITDKLKEEILAGVYRPGDRLPGHVRLARLHGVSTITSNRALAELEQDGLVDRAPRRGTFVRDVRKGLNSILVPISAREQRRCPQLIEYLEGILKACKALALSVHLEPFESEHLLTPESIRDLNCQGMVQIGDPGRMFPYHALRLSGLPWIAVGVLEGEGHHFVSEDRAGAAEQLVRAMRARGCRRIGFLGNLAWQNHRSCRDGYLRATKDTRLEASLVRDSTPSSSLEAARALLGKVDGLIVAGAFAAVNTFFLETTDQRLPLGLFTEREDILDFEGRCYLAHLDHVEAGRRAVKLLAEAVEGRLPGPTRVLIPPRISTPGNAKTPS